MKAAVIEKFGDIPQFRDFPEPATENGDIPIMVKAAVLENFDKLTAGGTHYASKHIFPAFPAIVGHSGVGVLTDGSLVALVALSHPLAPWLKGPSFPPATKPISPRFPRGSTPWWQPHCRLLH